MYNPRTRSFNSFLYWGAQMMGAWLLSFVLDDTSMTKVCEAMHSLYRSSHTATSS
jgi:hypothetical protein